MSGAVLLIDDLIAPDLVEVVGLIVDRSELVEAAYNLAVLFGVSSVDLDPSRPLVVALNENAEYRLLLASRVALLHQLALYGPWDPYPAVWAADRLQTIVELDKSVGQAVIDVDRYWLAVESVPAIELILEAGVSDSWLRYRSVEAARTIIELAAAGGGGFEDQIEVEQLRCLISEFDGFEFTPNDLDDLIALTPAALGNNDEDALGILLGNDSNLDGTPIQFHDLETWLSTVPPGSRRVRGVVLWDEIDADARQLVAKNFGSFTYEIDTENGTVSVMAVAHPTNRPTKHQRLLARLIDGTNGPGRPIRLAHMQHADGRWQCSFRIPVNVDPGLVSVDVVSRASELPKSPWQRSVNSLWQCRQAANKARRENNLEEYIDRSLDVVELLVELHRESPGRRSASSVGPTLVAALSEIRSLRLKLNKAQQIRQQVLLTGLVIEIPASPIMQPIAVDAPFMAERLDSETKELLREGGFDIAHEFGLHRANDIGDEPGDDDDQIPDAAETDN